MLRKQVHFLSFAAAIGYAAAVASARDDDSLSRDPRRGFSHGLACVRVNGKYGYVNHEGTIAIEPQFPWAGDFSEGLAAVVVGRKVGYINTAGKIVIKPEFDLPVALTDSAAAPMLAAVAGYYTGSFGYFTWGGDVVLWPQPN
ncbi:MAG: WG repeat-containing protein, partial [Pirellulales bacterium]